MAKGKGEVKHIFLAQFKEGITDEEKEECIKRFQSIVPHFPSLKTFKWGEELSIANFDQGFTHVFDLTFESVEGVAQYISHPEHVAYAEFFLPKLEKFVAVDYTPK
ncbi:stress-response A/B barrel domain-containing protein HS1-like [Salvia hispanica]|uniref:stress-response A/B barrel domain-containing protein HS1-like n=1 Tax=Salvia hispanica TaxID=49212 RepID=UPI0020096747|nr:stress-response A/B barrel domain-containing protein HS1-like [Salvia hispanica]